MWTEILDTVLRLIFGISREHSEQRLSKNSTGSEYYKKELSKLQMFITFKTCSKAMI